MVRKRSLSCFIVQCIRPASRLNSMLLSLQMGYSYLESDTEMWYVLVRSLPVCSDLVCFVLLLTCCYFCSYNAAKLHQLGWYSNRIKTWNAGDGTETIYLTGITRYQEDPGGANDVHILKINKLGSSTDYYAIFNAKEDFNQGTKEAGNLVTVVSQGAEGTGYSTSTVEAQLGVGELWSISNFDKSGMPMVLTVNNISEDNMVASVTISDGGGSTATTSTTTTPGGGSTSAASITTTAATQACVPEGNSCAGQGKECCDGFECPTTNPKKCKPEV